MQLYISDVESLSETRIVVEDKTYSGKPIDSNHFVFHLKDIKRARTKPYSAEVFDGDDLIGNVSFKVKGKTATVKDDFDFGEDF